MEGMHGVALNRKMFIEALRSGRYEKGPTLPDDRGRITGGSGYCVCGLGYSLLGRNWKSRLGISARDCTAIIKSNDGPLSFAEIAKELAAHDFALPDDSGCSVHGMHDSACRDCRILAGHKVAPCPASP